MSSGRGDLYSPVPRLPSRISMPPQPLVRIDFPDPFSSDVVLLVTTARRAITPPHSSQRQWPQNDFDRLEEKRPPPKPNLFWVDRSPVFLSHLASPCPAPPGSGGVLYLPHLSGERSPFSDPSARAAFVGVGASTTRGAVSLLKRLGATS